MPASPDFSGTGCQVKRDLGPPWQLTIPTRDETVASTARTTANKHRQPRSPAGQHHAKRWQQTALASAPLPDTRAPLHASHAKANPAGAAQGALPYLWCLCVCHGAMIEASELGAKAQSVGRWRLSVKLGSASGRKAAAAHQPLPLQGLTSRPRTDAHRYEVTTSTKLAGICICGASGCHSCHTLKAWR